MATLQAVWIVLAVTAYQLVTYPYRLLTAGRASRAGLFPNRGFYS